MEISQLVGQWIFTAGFDDSGIDRCELVPVVIYDTYAKYLKAWIDSQYSQVLLQSSQHLISEIDTG